MKRFKKFVASVDVENVDLQRFQQIFEQLWVDSYTRIEFSPYNSRHEVATKACDDLFESFGLINNWYYTLEQYNRIKRIENGLENL